MFKNVRDINLTSSTSAFSSALSVHLAFDRTVKAAVTYPYSIDVLTFESNLDYNPKCKTLVLSSGKESFIDQMVLQAKLVSIDGILFIIVLQCKTIQFYKENGFKLVRAISASDLPMLNDYDNFDSYFKGVAGFESKVIIGHNSGALYGFTLFKEKFSNKIKFDWYHRSHHSSIAELDINKKYLASADSGSIIKIWESNEVGFHVKLTFEGRFGIPFTCVKLYNDMVIAGHSSGHIRIYSIDERGIVAEVMAHVKFITAIDISLDSGLMITASEDTFIQVWQLKNMKNCWINHLFSIHNPNLILVGCAFLDRLGNAFSSISYDSNYLRLYQR